MIGEFEREPQSAQNTQRQNPKGLCDLCVLCG